MSKFESDDNKTSEDESVSDETVFPTSNASSDSNDGHGESNADSSADSKGDVVEAELVGDGSGGGDELEPTKTGTVIDASDQPIRYGSPFAVDPLWYAPIQVEPELFLDVGSLRYTAMGSVAASGMVVLFASAAAYWFPGGGTLVAGLGGLLAIFGLFSHYRLHALGCLIVHLLLFMTSYTRALS